MTVKVLNLTRAAGVNDRLMRLLDDWAQLGTHDITIAGGPGIPNGGVRTDVLEQHKAYVAGLTRARTLADTPHGRGAALDVWPLGFNWHRTFEEQPGMKDRMVDFGWFAEARGLIWGGRWSSLKDYPHVELPNWLDLPYPPPQPGVDNA